MQISNIQDYSISVNFRRHYFIISPFINFRKKIFLQFIFLERSYVVFKEPNTTFIINNKNLH